MLFAKKLASAGMFTTLALLIAVTDVSAISSGGIGGRPAYPDPNNPRTQSIFIFNVDKGETKKDVILVANNSDSKQTINLYAVDGVVTNTGSFTCSQESEARQNVGAWTRIDKTVVVLDAGKTEEVGFSVSMPAAADVGEHNGCIVFQVAEDEGEASGNVRIRTRQAIRVVATVPGDLKRSVEITGFSTGTQAGNQSYILNLKNNGNVSADVDSKVYLKSLFGRIVYENGGGYPVLADRPLDLTFVDESRPFFGGWYYASAEISYDDRAGTFGTANSQYLTKKVTDSQVLFRAPTIGGALTMTLVILLVAGITGWLLRKRYNKRSALKVWQSQTIGKTDSIQSIATQHGITWQKLASVNGISAPYVLKEGDTLLVPPKEKPIEKKSAKTSTK
ncbi:MAG: LysM domain-containing protein [Candidatus Saccharimonadales bacterium]